MNYPEELREKWNECMYDERDIIQRFLEKQYDIRYGRQRDSWHFEPALSLMNNYGHSFSVSDIRLDKNKFVVFIGQRGGGTWGVCECTDFVYGELRRVIEALPDADEIVKKRAIGDLKEMEKNLRVDLLLKESPFVYEFDGEVLRYEGCSPKSEYNYDKLGLQYGTDFLVKMRDHIHIEHLHRTKEYKELMELLSLEENLRFECQNYGDATFVIDGTDVTFDVSSVRRNDNGGLVIYGNDIDADVCDSIELTEKDIKREYLVGIINEMKTSKYCVIINTYNGHNEELVRKINAAWKDIKYHDSFGDILYALACRDMVEWEEKYNDIIHDSEDAMNHAHEIMEGVCDDWDLETILSFIRYKE